MSEGRTGLRGRSLLQSQAGWGGKRLRSSSAPWMAPSLPPPSCWHPVHHRTGKQLEAEDVRFCQVNWNWQISVLTCLCLPTSLSLFSVNIRFLCPKPHVLVTDPQTSLLPVFRTKPLQQWIFTLAWELSWHLLFVSAFNDLCELRVSIIQVCGGRKIWGGLSWSKIKGNNKSWNLGLAGAWRRHWDRKEGHTPYYGCL